MKIKNVIANSTAAKRLINWIESAKDEMKKIERKPELVEVIPEYPIAELIEKGIPPFQRNLQARRLIKIARKVLKFGFLFIPVVLDETMRIIDGQHRLTVAYLLGYETIPVAIYKFKVASDKPDLFSEISMPEGGAPAILDRMNSRKIAKWPYESMIYRLILEDDASIFYDKVTWKGIKDKTKITLPVFIKIFNWIGLGVRRTWQSENDGMLQHMTGNMTEEEYIELRGRLNTFGKWFQSWAGDDRSSNPELYKDKIIVGFMDFYLHMIKGSKSKKDFQDMLKRSRKKLFSFNPANVARQDHEGVVIYLLDELNYNKQQKNRLQFTKMETRVSF